MAERDTATLKAAALALLPDNAAANSIQPPAHRALLEDLIDSRGVVGAVKADAVITLTMADGTTVTITEQASSRPAGAQYHATIGATSARATAADLTAGAPHRDSQDGTIAGWPAQATNAWLWIWSSHELTFIANGVANNNLFVSFGAPTRLQIGETNGYLYGSLTAFTPAALNLNWTVR